MQKSFITNTSSIFFNIFLIIFLLLGIQNSNERKAIQFLDYKSIRLPISFIIGTSFITGSLMGTIVFSVTRINGNNQN